MTIEEKIAKIQTEFDASYIHAYVADFKAHIEQLTTTNRQLGGSLDISEAEREQQAERIAELESTIHRPTDGELYSLPAKLKEIQLNTARTNKAVYDEQVERINQLEIEIGYLEEAKVQHVAGTSYQIKVLTKALRGIYEALVRTLYVDQCMSDALKQAEKDLGE